MGSSKSSIIFIHGYCASSEWWRSVKADMGDQTASALDMRGCGLSDKMRDGYQVNQMAADVAAFMEAEGCPHR